MQDREILPGIIYAVHRLLLKPLAPALADSYFIYTIMGICLNAMVVLPLLVLFRCYYPQGHAGLFLLLISLNAFVLSNYYFTWFKLSGAALFLCALVVLLDDDGPWYRWTLAGPLFGLAANMHAGNALGIPLFFLWLLWRHWRRWGRWRTTCLSAALLCVLFVAANLPWAIVKGIYFPDNQALLKLHFLNGHSPPDGLWASVRTFIQAEPLRQQLPWRWAQLAAALRIKELASLAGFLQSGEWFDFFYFWNKYEWKFPALTLWPYLLLLGSDALVRRNKGIGASSTDQTPASHGELARPAVLLVSVGREGAGTTPGQRLEDRSPTRERRTVGVLAAGALLAVVVAKSAAEPPDSLHSLPLGPYMLLLSILIGAALQMRPALRCLYGAAMVIAAGRLVWGLMT